MTLKTFLKNKFNSKKFRLNGVVPSSRLPDNSQLCENFRDHMVYAAEQLPPKVDLRTEMTPVEDQSRVGSCSANSLAGAYEYLMKKANGRNTDVSRLFIYYNARVKDQRSHQVVDAGCTMTSAIEALAELGTCLESIWPYNISHVNTRPSAQAYQEAAGHRIISALRININLHEMKSCLAQGFPFAFGLRLYASFDQAAKTGVVPTPNLYENGRQSHGSHALLAVGYSDQSRAFIVRNSWGEQWGDQGYCYIPYEYLTNPSLCFDVWTVRQLATDDFGREHWDTDDVIDYINDKEVELLGSPFENNGEIIETDDDDDDEQEMEIYDSHYESNDNGQKWNDQYESWNQYEVYKGDSYVNANDLYGYLSETYPDNNNFYSDQYYQRDNNNNNNNDYSKYLIENTVSKPRFVSDGSYGDYYNYNQSVSNTSNYYRNPYPSPTTFYQPQQYGFSYGYTSPFNHSNYYC